MNTSITETSKFARYGVIIIFVALPLLVLGWSLIADVRSGNMTRILLSGGLTISFFITIGCLYYTLTRNKRFPHYIQPREASTENFIATIEAVHHGTFKNLLQSDDEQVISIIKSELERASKAVQGGQSIAAGLLLQQSGRAAIFLLKDGSYRILSLDTVEVTSITFSINDYISTLQQKNITVVDSDNLNSNII